MYMTRLKRQNTLADQAMIRPLSQLRTDDDDDDDDGTARFLRNVGKKLSFCSA
jgi:hypothetical protein